MKTRRIYTVVANRDEGALTRSGDTEVIRHFSDQRTAECFAAGKRLWGAPAAVSAEDVPIRIARRYGF